MAITYGGSLGSINTGGVSSRTLTSLSISGTDLLLVVGVRTETTTKTVSSAVWDNGSGGNSQSLTQLGTYKDAEGGNHRLSIWYLVNPSTSNSRVSVTINANDTLGISAAYYTGVDQSSPFGTVSSGGPSTGDPWSQLLTSDRNGSWAFIGAISGNAGLTFTTGTQRQALPSSGYLADSNSTVANAGTYTFAWSGGSSSAWIAAMMRPVASLNYTITAALGTFTLTGISALFHIALNMAASLGTFTLTGIAALFSLGKGIVAETGTFIVTGIDTAFNKTLNMVASVGEFTLTGIASAFIYGRVLAASVGSFILTGFDIRMPRFWSNQTKNSSTFSNQAKNSSSWDNQGKTDI